jgi:hypothetical protein
LAGARQSSTNPDEVVTRWTAPAKHVVGEWYDIVENLQTGAAGTYRFLVNGVNRLDLGKTNGNAIPLGYYEDQAPLIDMRSCPRGWCSL